MLTKNKNKKLIGKFSFRFVGAVMLIVVFVLGSALSKEVYREYMIKKDIDTLKTQIESMKKDNYELSQLIQYYQTDQYKESEARARLNLKGDGEKVVMIDNKKNNVEDVQKTADQQKNDALNYQKWWSYFFASRG
jgi:cell division protein FtsB